MVSVRASRDRTCARRKAQKEQIFARCAMGMRVFAFNARSGPIPLSPGVHWVVEVGRGRVRTLWLVGCSEFCDWVRFALGTLEGAAVSVRASRDRTCARRKAQREEIFARCAKG